MDDSKRTRKLSTIMFRKRETKNTWYFSVPMVESGRFPIPENPREPITSAYVQKREMRHAPSKCRVTIEWDEADEATDPQDGDTL